MKYSKNKKNEDLDIEIGLKEGQEWSDEKLARIKALVKSESNKRSPQRVLRNEFLTITYQMEEYLDNEEIPQDKLFTIKMFLASFLLIMGLSRRKFATHIDITDGNLLKYLSGERKFNTDLAMKFSSFFHTTPDIWLNVQTKNDLIRLYHEKEKVRKYSKYDYQKVLSK